jgi:hypothetical protein
MILAVQIPPMRDSEFSDTPPAVFLPFRPMVEDPTSRINSSHLDCRQPLPFSNHLILYKRGKKLSKQNVARGMRSNFMIEETAGFGKVLSITIQTEKAAITNNN